MKMRVQVAVENDIADSFIKASCTVKNVKGVTFLRA